MDKIWVKNYIDYIENIDLIKTILNILIVYSIVYKKNEPKIYLMVDQIF